MATYEPGMVVRVPFPFVDSAETKHRPALVLSNEEFNRTHEHVVLAMITSAKHSSWSTDTLIGDIAGTGLKVPSVIRFKFFTLDARLIAGSLGCLGSSDWNAVRTKLKLVLA